MSQDESRPVADPHDYVDWTCPRCGAMVDFVADACWSCGLSRSKTSPPASTPPTTCSKCGGAMEEGFLMGAMQSLPVAWYEGKPKGSFWSGGINWLKRPRRKVRADRCTRCGLIEFYAAEPTRTGWRAGWWRDL